MTKAFQVKGWHDTKMGMLEVECFLGRTGTCVIGSWYLCRRMGEGGDGTVTWFQTWSSFTSGRVVLILVGKWEQLMSFRQNSAHQIAPQESTSSSSVWGDWDMGGTSQCLLLSKDDSDLNQGNGDVELENEVAVGSY